MSTMTGSEAVGSLQNRPVVRCLLHPLASRLKVIATSGLSSRDLVRTICVGAAIGLMPLVWGNSLLCILAGRWFRLNQLVLQSINYLLYPLQLALLVPFCRLGNSLLPGGPAINTQQLSNLLQGNFTEAVPLLAWLSLKGLLFWLVTVPPIAWLVYRLLPVALVKVRAQTAPAVDVAGL